LLDEAAEEFDIKAQGIEDDPIVVEEASFKSGDSGFTDNDIEGHTFMVTNMKLDDDRQGTKQEIILAFDECEHCHNEEIIEYEVFRAGKFGSINATSTLVRSFKFRKPVLLQVRGFVLRYRGPKVTITEVKTISGSDIRDMPTLEEVGDEGHFFTIGKYKFSLDKAYNRSFFIREMFVHDLQFIGHAIAFQGIVGVAKAEVRIMLLRSLAFTRGIQAIE